jgi:hypothetical protein
MSSSIHLTSCGSLWIRHSTRVSKPSRRHVDLPQLGRVVWIGNVIVPSHDRALRFQKLMDAFDLAFEFLMRRQFSHGRLTKRVIVMWRRSKKGTDAGENLNLRLHVDKPRPGSPLAFPLNDVLTSGRIGTQTRQERAESYYCRRSARCKAECTRLSGTTARPVVLRGARDSPQKRDRNEKSRLLFGVLGGTGVMLGTAASQRADLPAGPNLELVSRKCQGCHDLSVVVDATGLSREDWNATIEEMITSNGMSVTPEERSKILDYLSSYLGSSVPHRPAQ